MSREALFFTAAPRRRIGPHLAAANVDLTSPSPDFSRKVCGAQLPPVLDTLRRSREMGGWLEVTTLVIPGKNDADEDLRGCATFIARELGPEVPWHVSAFHPACRLANRPRTPVETPRRARAIGQEAGLRHLCQGKIPGEGEDTLRPGGGRTVVSRIGFEVRSNRLRAGCCPDCGTPPPSPSTVPANSR